MSKSGGCEPYTVRTLTRWVEETYRPTLLPHSDKIFHAYELPSGATIVIPGPSAAQRPVPTNTARKLAVDAGLSYEEFREAIGHPIIKHTRPSRKPIKAKPRSCSKSQVMRAAADVRAALARVEGSVKQGVRDPAFYLRLHQHLTRALAATEAAINETTQTGAPRR